MRKKTKQKQPQVDSKQDVTLSDKKKTSLVTYLAILFLAALAIVTVSLIIQIRGNTEEYNTIAEKAYALQEENEGLQKENETQRQERDQLQHEADRLTEENAQLRTQLEEQQAQNSQLEAANESLNNQIGLVSQAYDLLSDAKAAAARQDDEAFRTALKALEPLYQCLSEQAQAEYDALLDAMTPEEP